MIGSRFGPCEVVVPSGDEFLSIPCNLSVGSLRLDPVWDPLRDHPRFKALLEEYEVE